jgi:SAM-dependent methyltransferase
MKDAFKYSGGDNLDVMQHAVHYNKFLASLVTGRCIDLPIKALDIGAGTGTISELIRNAGWNVVCMEPDAMQAEMLRKKDFITHTVADTLAGEQFDFIYSFNVLEHIEDDKAALEKWSKWLKPNGTLLIYVPAFPCLFSSMDKKVGHFRRYRRKTLTQIVMSAGLQPLQTAGYIDSLGFFITWLYKLIHREDGNINRRSLIFYDRYLFPVSRLLDKLLYRLIGKNVFIVCKKTVG